MNVNNTMNDNEIVDDSSIDTLEREENSAVDSKLHTVQVSRELPIESHDEQHETVMSDVAMSSLKFSKEWFKKKLIRGVIHHKLNQVIDDFGAFDAWVIDFRVIGKAHKHAQMHF